MKRFRKGGRHKLTKIKLRTVTIELSSFIERDPQCWTWPSYFPVFITDKW